MRKNYILCSSLIAVMLMFSGCESTQGVDTGSTVNTETVIAADSENEDVLSSDNEGTSDNSNPAESESSEAVKKEIIIEPDNSYIYEGLCKVNAEYDETAGGAPVDTIVKELRKDSYEGMVLLSHTVDGDTDTVKYKVIPTDISDKARPYIICNAVFAKEGDEWSLSSKEWSEWVIKRNELSGSSWVTDSEEAKDFAKLFESGFEFKEGSNVYIHIKRNLYLISVLKNDDPSVFETKFGTSFGGSIYYINDEENKSVDFTCTEGIVNDEGLLSFKLVTDNGEADFEPGNGNSFISDGFYKLCISGETDDLKSADVIENLDTFEVTSKSIFYGEWIKETGGQNGNVSPELSWEKVDGAGAYAIMITDLDTDDYFLHGYRTSDTTHLDYGDLGDDEFLGPIPPSPHNYKVYVFALKEAVDPGLRVAKQNCHPEHLFDLLNKDNPGNVIAYGTVTASYEYLGRVW